MKQLQIRPAFDNVQHHKANPVRVYATDAIQSERIARTRGMLTRTLLELGAGHKSVMELGCGVCDISGPFSITHEVMGIECNPGNIARARELYPDVVIREVPVEDVDPFPCDVLVLCEILEHLENPAKIVGRWLPLAKACVISHPLDEPMGSQLSGGDHSWSFTENDLREWHRLAGHLVREFEKLQMGNYVIGISRGVRAA